TIYVNWSDQRNGEHDTDVWISKSTDKGSSWSDPVRVNNDVVAMMGRHQCYNWMAVDPITGHIYIVFYDRRDHDDLKTDVYLAISTDGGETFINEKISQKPFEPDSDIYMGDYINISAYGGFVRPVWTSLDNGTLSILSAIIDLR
ncbi:MAG: exo-alpha-sialidase, partial [Cyclobacteriaceae bacterium]|nr:exo-alpha-sialidase [Cyclobacteriaceae bacterium]